MNGCERCTLCRGACTIEEAAEKRVVNCHVRSHHDDRFTVWRCPECQSLHSREEADLAYYYADYPLKKHVEGFHIRVAYANRIKFLRQLGVENSATVLDYGCGAGLFVRYMRQRGFSAVAGYDFFVPEFSSQAVLETTYDVVVSYDVIEHLDDPVAFFDTLVKLTKPGGLLVVGTPDATTIRLAENPPPAELSQPFHRHILSEKALVRLAADRGMRPVQTIHRSYFDSPVPSANLRFLWGYVHAEGGMLDSAVEPIRFSTILRSPRLWWWALMGYVLPHPGNMLLSFRKATK